MCVKQNLCVTQIRGLSRHLKRACEYFGEESPQHHPSAFDLGSKVERTRKMKTGKRRKSSSEVWVTFQLLKDCRAEFLF